MVLVLNHSPAQGICKHGRLFARIAEDKDKRTGSIMNKFLGSSKCLWIMTFALALLLGSSASVAAASPPSAWTALDPALQREFPTNDPNKLELWLYTDKLSYLPGDEIIFYVHTTADAFDIKIERDGESLRKVFGKAGIKGQIQKTPKDAYAIGAKWDESLRLRMPGHLTSGVYLVTATAAKDDKQIQAEHFFVVRAKEPGQSSKAALLLSTATYVAYNDWGGGNSYRSTTDGEVVEAPQPKLALQRPWARGFVRLPQGAPRHGAGSELSPKGQPRYPCLEWSLTHGYSRHYSDAGWAFYERHFAAWAEREGYKLEYLTQHDLHNDPGILANYQLIIIVGHDQYWSGEMRDGMDNYLEQGGKLARFAGGLLWQIRMEDGGNTQVCYKNPDLDPISKGDTAQLSTTIWEHPLVNRPVSHTFGLSGLSGGYIRMGAASPRGSGGFTVYRPGHWAFKGAGLYYGDVIGARAGVASYMVDGLDYTFKNGLPFAARNDAAAQGIEILALAPASKAEADHFAGSLPQLAGQGVFQTLVSGLKTQAAQEGEPKDAGLLSPYGSAMIAVYAKGKGEVFNAGSSMWINGLIKGDEFIQTITRNVLNRYLGIAE